MLGTRSAFTTFKSDSTARSIENFKAMELQFWNEWEMCCKFENATGMNEAMRKISLIQDIIYEFKKDVLGR